MVAFCEVARMLTQEQAVKIRVLAGRSVGTREIAGQLGCSRNTVRRYLADEKAVRGTPRPQCEAKLEPLLALLATLGYSRS
jgi:transposase